MNKSVVVILHLGYWFCFFLLLFVVFATPNVAIRNPPPISYQIQLISFTVLLPAALTFYSFYFILFDRFLRSKRFLWLILGILLIPICTTILGFILGDQLLVSRLFPNNRWITAVEVMVVLSFIALINGILGLVLKGFVTWFGELREKEELQRKNLETEMALVKSQIQPHFLFNTINNIDVLISRDAIKASRYLQKLSDLMRFMLYETKTNRIPLSLELDQIKRYIDLQKIRTSNPDFVHYEVIGETGMHRIAPMIFIPIIENAFKHSGNKKTSGAIEIRIQIKESQITLNCSNLLQESDESLKEEGGLGKSLIEKRLELLYPHRHILMQGKNEEYYHVSVTLNLTDD